MPTDPVALTQDLIRCPSITPEEGGALVLVTHNRHVAESCSQHLRLQAGRTMEPTLPDPPPSGAAEPTRGPHASSYSSTRSG